MLIILNLLLPASLINIDKMQFLPNNQKTISSRVATYSVDGLQKENVSENEDKAEGTRFRILPEKNSIPGKKFKVPGFFFYLKKEF
ncbi:MAG: hypothetical protein Tsb0015_11080 [Simkaniaceae bacterium]